MTVNLTHYKTYKTIQHYSNLSAAPYLVHVNTELPVTLLARATSEFF